MKARETAVILATGGMGLVRAAYSAGKPAYGVGPGNAPAYIERTADLGKAVRDIITGKTFDNGLLCSSENSVVVDAPLAEEAKRLFTAEGAHFLSAAERDALAKVLVTPQRLPNPALVGRPATYIAQQAGIPGRAGHARPDRGAGRRGPRLPALDRKALSGPLVLCSERLARGLRALQADSALRRHGSHDVDPFTERRRDPAVRAEEAGLPNRRQHADDARVDWADDGSGSVDDARVRRLRRQYHVGQHLPAHLLNIKRLAYETTPVATCVRPPTRPAAEVVALPKAPAAPKAPGGIGAASLARRIDEFLASRGLHCRSGVHGPRRRAGSGASSKARVCRRTPAQRAGRLSSKRLRTSCAKTTSDRRCGRDGRSW